MNFEKQGGSFWGEEGNFVSISNQHEQMRNPHEIPRNNATVHKSPNVFRLLARREVAPRAKQSSRMLWGEVELHPFQQPREARKDPKHELISWVEAESLRHLSAKYCPLLPPPRSTIAAAFSPNGKTLASTHGDHTVKIIDCQTGSCLKVLSGHRRTPWVVRFHPLHPEILASGSLDHEVRIWDANTAECIDARDFYRPIASIAFHAQGELLAVASGHRLYIWHYNRRCESSSPSVILRTKRSLRAVHFHPHAAPFLLTAEVNDLDSADSSMTPATSPGYLHYPPPTVYFADTHLHDRSRVADELPLVPLPVLMWPSFTRDEGRVPLQQTEGEAGVNGGQQRVDPSTSVRLLTYSTPSGQYELLLSPIEPNVCSNLREEAGSNAFSSEMEPGVSQSAVANDENMEVQADERSAQPFPLGLGDSKNWELPFLQGWLMGHSLAGPRTIYQANGGTHENSPALGDMGVSTSAVVVNQSRVAGRSGRRYRPGDRVIPTAVFGESPVLSDSARDGSDTQASRQRSEFAASLAAASSTELPCTVKLKIWRHDVKNPYKLLDTSSCCLTVSHAVLCSEMGAHFSPCGRFLAACVACMLPPMESDPGLISQVNHDVMGMATSPTRHPVSAHQIMYELRIYSLEEANFGLVLASRPIRAAHCLTSIQFSPTSEHLLLAYGRRHNSLLKCVVIDGESTVPIYTILEVYRVSDMELVRVLPSAEDEVNVACFHPTVGGGLVYGTKEGKLRILQYDSSHGMNLTSSGYLDENMSEELLMFKMDFLQLITRHNQHATPCDIRPFLQLCEYLKNI